jgi:hypothetical protein
VYPTLSHSAPRQSCSPCTLSCVGVGVGVVKRGGDADDWEPDDWPLRDESAARSHQPCVRRMATADGGKKGAIRISDAMAITEWINTRAAATQRLRQCAQTALCRHRRVPPLPSAVPAASARTLRAPELTPNPVHTHGGATGSIFHAEGACGATGSGRLEGWMTASKLRVWGCQGAMCAKKVGSGRVGLARTISIPVQTTGHSFRTSRS